ncbi:MAG: S1C family serine protease [Sandaracinaceae bacterium]|nr:S1C family serine protease [Sandaracinaceae bacterium]
MKELSEELAQLVARVGASVVRVEGGRPRPASGIAWDERHVITVARAVRAERVQVAIGEATLAAKVKGRDMGTDLALLEVEPGLASLGAAPIAREVGGPAVGQLAVRLARPGRTVQASLGVVSALGDASYTAAGGGEIDRYLECDAAHRPGFSGGALVSVDGVLLGLTSTAIVPGHSVQVPRATLERVVAQLAQHGRVRESYLGLVLRPTRLPRSVIDATGETVGLLVLDVDAQGPAAASGVRYGDTVLHLGDDSVRTVEDVWRYLRADRVGSAVPLTLWREGRVETVSLTLGARPS